MKKLLISLFACLGIFISFASAGVITFVNSGGSYSPSSVEFVYYGYLDRNYVLDYSCSSEYCNINVGNDCIIDYEGDMNVPLTAQCSFYNGNYNVISENNLFDYITVDFGNAFDGPGMSSSQCELEYNLIPISSVDSSYCESNNLCSVSSGSGDIVWSNVYINDILHIGASNIYMTIPSEFDWDYSYDSGSVMNIDIVGYNVDSDYIQGIVDTQKFTPDSDDFNLIIQDLLPKFIPGMVIILFLYFVFRFIKKIF